MDRQEYRRRLSARLRGARAESGLSQKDVERATGLDTSRLSRIEKGERAIELEDLLVAALHEPRRPVAVVTAGRAADTVNAKAPPDRQGGTRSRGAGPARRRQRSMGRGCSSPGTRRT